MPRDTSNNLTFDVKPHPHAKVGDEAWLLGEVHVSLKLPVSRDLQPGEVLYCNVFDGEGNEIHKTAIEVEQLAFPPMKIEGTIVGTMRVHKSAQNDELA